MRSVTKLIKINSYGLKTARMKFKTTLRRVRWETRYKGYILYLRFTLLLAPTTRYDEEGISPTVSLNWQKDRFSIEAVFL